MENFKFVFLNSAFLIPFAVGVFVLGFLFGFFHWHKWTKKLSELRAETDDLKRGRSVTNRLVTADTEKTSATSPTIPVGDFKFKDIKFD